MYPLKRVLPSFKNALGTCPRDTAEQNSRIGNRTGRCKCSSICTQRKGWNFPHFLTFLCQENLQAGSPLACDRCASALLFQPTDPFAESLIGDKFTCEFIIPLSVLRASCNKPATKRTYILGFALTPPIGPFLTSPHLLVGRFRRLPLAESSPACSILRDVFNN